MSAETQTKAVTARLPLSLYEASQQLAKRRRVSLNKLLQESLRATLRAEQEEELYAAFTLVGQAGAEETDVEFALAAQREVLLDDDQ